MRMQRLSSYETHADDETVDLSGSLSPDSFSPLQHSTTAERLVDHEHVSYRLYKRRFVGLAQLVLLNIVVSWDWLSFAAISTTAAHFFDVNEATINWLSTAFLFAFVAVSPVVIFTLNRSPKISMDVSSALILIGSWVRYAGTRSSPPQFGVVMFGQVLIGFSQAFVLAAPTRFSNLWFSDSGRVSATAVATLANPLGAAIGQLVSPFWASSEAKVPTMILYTAVLSTVAALPSPFLPKAPPTPPSAVAAAPKLSFREAFNALPKIWSFWVLLVPWTIYVASFNGTSTVINQIFSPYGFTETQAGIAGALLIFVGLGAAAVVSPILDRTRKYTLAIKILVPIIATSYLVLVFMPETRSVSGPWAICAILGASSFSLLPCALEYLALITHPISPEMTSTVAWAISQLFGALYILIMEALKGGWAGQPRGTMKRALVFQAVLAWVAVPFAMVLGLGRLRKEESAVAR